MDRVWQISEMLRPVFESGAVQDVDFSKWMRQITMIATAIGEVSIFTKHRFALYRIEFYDVSAFEYKVAKTNREMKVRRVSDWDVKENSGLFHARTISFVDTQPEISVSFKEIEVMQIDPSKYEKILGDEENPFRFIR